MLGQSFPNLCSVSQVEKVLMCELKVRSTHCKMCIFGVGYLCALVRNIQEHQELCVGQEDSPREEPSPTFKDDSLSVHLHSILLLV